MTATRRPTARAARRPGAAAQPLTEIVLRPPARPSRPPARAAGRGAAARRADHRRRDRSRCPPGTTILDACRAAGIDTPTLCYPENLTPVNVCRVCVVEVTGARVLAPACSRRVEAGMEVQTDSERVRTVAEGRAGVPGLLGRRLARRSGRAGRHDPRVHGALRRGSVAVRAAGRRRPRRASGTRARPGTTTPRRARRPPRPSPSPSRSTTTSTSATTRSASSATSASRRAARTPRTRSPSPSPGAASTPGSPPSRTCRCPTRPASTAATASASARPAR